MESICGKQWLELLLSTTHAGAEARPEQFNLQSISPLQLLKRAVAPPVPVMVWVRVLPTLKLEGQLKLLAVAVQLQVLSSGRFEECWATWWEVVPSKNALQPQVRSSCGAMLSLSSQSKKGGSSTWIHLRKAHLPDFPLGFL